MYRVTIYFSGPLTQWSGKVDAREIIAEFDTPFLLLARLRADNLLASLNLGRCGYCITRGDVTVMHVEPEINSDPCEVSE